jgi:hypothetical protein
MAKKIVIKSRHKSLTLAKRHARRLASEYIGNVRVTRRTASGTFSKRGTHYTFTIIPLVPKKMWRIIVSFPYLTNKQGSHKKGSPDIHDYKVIYFGPTKAAVLAKKADLRKRAASAVSRKKKAWIAEQREGRFYRKINVSVQRVDFDLRKLNTTEVMDE